MVREVSLLEIVLEDAFGCQVRVPQLLGLWHPTRVLGASPLASVEIVLDPRARPAAVEAALVGAVGVTCDRCRVELVALDADGARWRISGVPRPDEGPAALADAVMTALAHAGIGLGRSAAPT